MSDRTVSLRSRRGTTIPIRGDGTDAGVLLSIETHGGSYAEGLQHLFERLPPDATVLDVGANIGVVSVLAAGAVPAGRVFAFEPAPGNLRHLEANVAPLPHVEIVPVAVGSADTTLRFDVNDAYPAGAHLAVDGGVEVPCRALDSWAGDEALTRVDLLKIDVEGAEPLVLDGARETIRRHRPVVVAECNVGALRRVAGTTAADLQRRLADLVPHVGVLRPDGLILPVEDDDDLELCLGFDGVVDLVGTWERPGLRSQLRGRREVGRLAARLRPTAPPDPHNFVISGDIALDVRTTDDEGALDVDVHVRNGSRWWLSPDFVYHPVTVGARWDGTVEAARADLDAPIPPGGSGHVRLRVPRPDRPGRHRLQVTLVQEHFAWLADLDPRWSAWVEVQVG